MITPGSVFRNKFAEAGTDEVAVPLKRTFVLEGSRKRKNDLVKGRLILVAIAFCGIYAAIAAQLTYLASQSDKAPVATARAVSSMLTARPDLIDRRGRVLAQDIKTSSLYADPSRISDPEGVLEQLSTVLDNLNYERLLNLLNRDARFVWLRRELTPAQEQAILDLGIPGIGFQREYKRFYPGGNVASHIVGHVNVDNQGIAGFEKYVDQNFLAQVRALGLPVNEKLEPVKLSVDMRVQHVVRDELAKAMQRYQALAAIGVILDAKTGEVVAMSSLPDYDPNNPAASLNKDSLNRATAGVFEMGSTFKSFTTAMALDNDRVSIHDSFDATKPLRISGHTIRDFHAKRRVLSVPEIFIYSSNIGTAKMALEVGTEGHRDFLKRLRLLEPANIELPEVGKPIEPSKWKKISSMTISFGHGVSVTPLQTISAAAALVNGGKLIPPTFRPRTQEEANEIAEQVISPETSDQMRYLFRLNAEKGSGRRAEVSGYRVGGKTGTAEKVVNGRYSSTKKLNSFLSAFPIEDPRYVMLIMIDEPKPAEGQPAATAGYNAAPTTAAIIRRVATTLGIAPQNEHGIQPMSISYPR